MKERISASVKRFKLELILINMVIKLMASSLDKLVVSLVCIGKDKISFLERKGVYPYCYMICIKKIDETNLLPKEKYFNRLNASRISNSDYENSKGLWREFGITKISEFHDLYLKSDVWLLANVFEEFTKLR